MVARQGERRAQGQASGKDIEVTRLLAACIALGLLSACSDEPETVVVDPIEEDEVDYAETEPAAWDGDGDGLLNQEEYSNLSDEAWARWDSGQDGSLAADEFATGWSEAGFTDAAGAFAAMDEDGDGIVAQEDFLGAALWNEWDSDDSGVLEPEEFAYY